MNGYENPDGTFNKEEMREIMKNMHPWFVEQLETDEGKHLLEFLHEDMFDVWHK